MLDRARRTAALMMAPLPLFLLFVWYLYNFAAYVYPQVPQQFGGGRPRDGSLLFRTDAVAEARAIGFDVTERDPLTPPLRILWENEEIYVIESPDTPVAGIVRIDKSLVSAVIVDPIARPTQSSAGT